MTKICELKPFFSHADGSKSAVIFEVCDWFKLYELAAYGGFPARYPHYTWGLEYHELMKSQEYGLQKIYEMVINNDPIYAYLLRGNSLVDDKLVMAHVYAHADFFVNNKYFQHTNRKAVDMMANHAVRIRRFQEHYGAEEIERWLDICLSLDNLIDIHYPALQRKNKKNGSRLLNGDEASSGQCWNGRFQAKDYMDEFINPPEEIEAYKKKHKAEKEREADINEREIIFPAEPERDVLLFLARHAPLKKWQREVLLMIREEAYYFVPQAQTKIMNEGWASYWHAKAMCELCIDNEVIDYAEHNAGTMAESRQRLNPYRLGKKMFEHIEWRWDTHRHGKIYQECDEQEILSNWDQFVVFKNIYEECGGDREETLRRWREFLCFWKAIESDENNLFKVVYTPRMLLPWWHYYLTVYEQLGRIDSELRKYLDKFNEYNDELNKAERKGDLIACERFRSRKEFLSQYIIPHCRGIKNFLSHFSVMREKFQRGKLRPKEFCLPLSFFDYAKRFVGKLKIADGRRKIFEVRENYCDVTFLEEFFSSELCVREKMFGFAYNADNDYYLIDSLEFKEIKERLCAARTNNGEPLIMIVDGNFKNRGELRLQHYDDQELKFSYAEDTLKNIYLIWRRPVHIDTVLDGERVRVSFNGEEVALEQIENPD